MKRAKIPKTLSSIDDHKPQSDHRSFRKLSIAMALGFYLNLLIPTPESVALEISFSGRLQEDSGKSVDGPLDFTVRFYNAPIDGDHVGPVLKLAQTELLDGVFQLSLNFDNSQLAAIFGDGSKPAYVQVDAGGKVYPRQRLIAVPLALRIPVDTNHLAYNTEGKLTIDRVDLSQVSGLAAALAAKAETSAIPVSSVASTNNLSDLADKAAARSNLGLGSLATASSVSPSMIVDSSITDTKLATIATAGKVSGTAITSGTIGGSTSFNSTGAITTSGAITGTGNFIVNGTGSATTEIRFNDDNNSNYVSLKAPGTLGSNVSFILPAADGSSGQVLSTNGVGGLGWSNLGGPALVTLTDAPTIAVDASLGTMFQVTLGGNRTLAAPTNQTPGATYTFKFSQDSTGNRTLAFDPAYVFPSTISSPQLSYLPDAVDIGQFVSDGTKMYYLTGWLSNAALLIGSLTLTSESPTQINLAWVDSNSTEVGYRIDRSPDNSTWTTLTTTAANATSYASNSLSEGTRYYYQVVTVRDSSNGAPVYANAWTPLNAPTSFDASAISSSAIVLTWVDNTTLETGYAVERSLTRTGGWTVITTTPSNAATYTDTGLSQFTRYYYRVRAVNANTVSSYAATIDAYTAPASGICGNNSADNCYLFNMSINSQLSTPGGKNLVMVYANGTSGLKVWKENSGTRILRANGLDQWTKMLNENGRGLSATDFTDANLGTSNTVLVGRVCPTNVYIDDSNMTTTGNCVYYSPVYPSQRLDATQNDATTNQTTTGNFRLGQWNSANGGNGTGASWYEGNIQTCGGKGMRLPTLYETTSTAQASNIPTDASPVFALSTGVPSVGYMWTSSASLSDTGRYWIWGETGTFSLYSYSYTYAVRCVVP